MSAMADAAPDGLRGERSGPVLRLALARPAKRNALCAPLVEALLRQLAAARGDGTRLAVLEGEGVNFSAGFDFEGYASQSEGDLVLRFVRLQQLLHAVRHAPFDTMALAHGRNFGAGADLFAACARRVAAPGTTFRMPGLRFGLVLGTRVFARRVGAERARRVLESSRTFSAEEALAWGFVEAIVPREGWAEAVREAEAQAQALASDAAERLFALTTPDTRDADLAELVRSAAAPGLKERIAAYLAER